MELNEPTAEQCSAKAKVYEDENTVGYAIWYPQMGGYVGKAVALLNKTRPDLDNGARMGGCFDVLVWHDGEFPFSSEASENPAQLHHCDPEQFIEFGKTLAELKERCDIYKPSCGRKPAAAHNSALEPKREDRREPRP